MTRVNVDGADDQRLVVDPFPFTLRRAANQRLIHLNGVLTADQVPVGAHHRSTQLMEHLESRFIARHAQPLLELEGAHPGRAMRHEIGAPKPGGYGKLATVDDGIRGQACVAPTGPAAHNPRSMTKAKGLASTAAARAIEAVWKAVRVQVIKTGHFVWEHALEVWKGLRRHHIWWYSAWHSRRVCRVAVGGNRIGMAQSTQPAPLTDVGALLCKDRPAAPDPADRPSPLPRPLLDDLGWEPDGVTLQVRFCEEPGNEAGHGRHRVAPSGNQAANRENKPRPKRRQVPGLLSDPRRLSDLRLGHANRRNFPLSRHATSANFT